MASARNLQMHFRLPGLRPLASISPSSATFLTSNNSPVGVQWPRLQASRKEPSVPALTRAFSSASSAWAPICAVGASRLLEQSPFDPRMITVRGLKPHPNKPFGERIVRRRKMRVHKLRKWRKKFMADIMRVKKKRELEKEKAFMAELNAFIEEGEKYDPREEVREFLERLNKFYYPKYWKGIPLIPSYIKTFVDEQMAKEKKKKEADLRAHVESLLDKWEKEGRLKY